MSLANPCPPTCSAEIWGRFLEALSGQRIKQKQWRWYAYRVERYFRTISSKPPEQHVREDVVGYLEALGVNGGLEDWQYAQVVEALQILFSRAVRPSWAIEMDWGTGKTPLGGPVRGTPQSLANQRLRGRTGTVPKRRL